MSDDLQEALHGWVESSGRALELRVARAALRARGQVMQSFGYNDVETNKSREGDVLAQFWWNSVDDARCRIAAVIECKNSSSKPWVAFHAPRAPLRLANDLSGWVTFAHGPFNDVIGHLAEIWIGHGPFSPGPLATHIVEALGGDGHNQANNAVMQAVSAADGFEARYRSTERRVQNASGVVILPAVVTAAPLFLSSLNDQAEIEFERVETLQLRAHRRDGTQVRVWVMNESAVAVFFADLADRARDAAASARGS